MSQQNNWQRLHNEDGDEEFANLESQQPQQQQQQPQSQAPQSQQHYNYPQQSKIRRPGAPSKPSQVDEEYSLFHDPQWEKMVIGVLSGTLFIVIMILVVSVIPVEKTQAGLSRDPEQIHLSLGDNETTMFFVWATEAHHSRTDLRYGIDKNYIVYYSDNGWTDSYKATNYTSPLFHYHLLTGLTPYATYYYQIGDKNENVWSELYSFKTPPEYNVPFTVAAVANLEKSPWSEKVLQLLNTTIHPNLGLLVGDISYAQGQQQKWDEWANWAQNYTVLFPWMFVPGNIENEQSLEFISYETRFPVSPGLQPPDNSTFGNRTHRSFEEREETFQRDSNSQSLLLRSKSFEGGSLRTVSKAQNLQMRNASTSTSATTTTTTTSSTTSTTVDDSTNNDNVTKREKYHYHSFDYSYVHFIQLSSELTPARNTSQFLWLASDLIKVNHHKTPWIIVSWHTPWYSSNNISQATFLETEKMRHAYERILYNHQVDICLSGHVHGYERTDKIFKNVTDPDGMYHISVGTGGSSEGLDSDWIEPQPSWSLFRKAAYGASSFRVFNETHIHWQYTNVEDGTVIDDFWFVQKVKKN